MKNGNDNSSGCKVVNPSDVSRYFTKVQRSVGETYYCMNFDAGLDVSSGIVEVKQESNMSDAFMMFLCHHANYVGAPFSLRIEGIKKTLDFSALDTYRHVKEYGLQLKKITFNTGISFYCPVYKGGTHYGIQMSLRYDLHTSTNNCHHDFEVVRNKFPKMRLNVFEDIVLDVREYLKKFCDYTDDMVDQIISENFNTVTDSVSKIEKMLNGYLNLFYERTEMYDRMCRRI